MRENREDSADPYLRAAARFARVPQRTTAGSESAHHRPAVELPGSRYGLLHQVFAVTLSLLVIGLALTQLAAGLESPPVSRAGEGGTVAMRGDGQTGEFLLMVIPQSHKLAPEDVADFTDSLRTATLVARRCLGAEPGDRVPLEVGSIGGPSGGLMLALTLIDQVDPRSLADGRRIAGTGALDADGSVLPVGSVPAKARMAEAAGTHVFLVPYEQAEEAKRSAPSLEVVGVHSVDEAVTVLTGSGCVTHT